MTRQQGNTRSKIELDANALKELLFLDANIREDEPNRKKRRSFFFDKVLGQLSPDSDRFYIKHYKK